MTRDQRDVQLPLMSLVWVRMLLEVHQDGQGGSEDAPILHRYAGRYMFSAVRYALGRTPQTVAGDRVKIRRRLRTMHDRAERVPQKGEQSRRFPADYRMRESILEDEPGFLAA